MLTFPMIAVVLQAAPIERAGVETAVNHYLAGQRTGNPAEYREAFAPEWRMIWAKDGQVRQMSAEEYIGRASGKPPANEAQRQRGIEMIDITGDAAIAKVVTKGPEGTMTDYLTLGRVGTSWKVISKTFNFAAAPKT